ncbi:unnamed protein product [Arabidopsis lyrata]|uniref:protein qua-1 n=1 Tax=Arabidopsis lyrata subsp. lyrata TaxID=81972 RepID=UPI000A29D920|nr:protein qua-1 [Arabidopsis lyrata subsp. lyrata]CAH8263911.1 unnamed protein product [Arabidopsis lyrata]|eukprot:XP_020885678.1 protein qua-1 [Arabidopsis lyrata subsp. lyrata]
MGKPTSQNNSSINHFSHPHRLQLSQATSSPPCSACKLAGGNGRVYSCRPCNFSLHESCSKMKQVITHPSHPSHTLSLLVAPIYDGGYFNCDGCGVHGTGFSYQCSLCDYDIHALCAYKPLSIIHNSHPQHNLKLVFQSPYGANKGFSCDICLKIGKNQWLYRCIPCEFDAHVGCITAPHLLQHSTSAPNPHTHHAGHPQHQNSLPMPNQGSNRPRPMPTTRPNRPIGNPNRPIAQNASAYEPRRQNNNNNNLAYNAQVGPIGPNELIGQGSMDGSGYDGSAGNEEFDVEVDVDVDIDVDVEVEYEGDVNLEEGNDEGEQVDGNGIEFVACGDNLSVAYSESDFGGSSDARSQCNDLSDADLYPPSLDNTQGPGPVRMKQGSGGGRKKNRNPNGQAARSKNIVGNSPRARLQGSKSPIQSPRGSQNRSVQNVRNNATRGRGGAVSVRVNRPRDPSAFIAPQGFNGPSGGPSNAVDNGGNNDNYNEVYGVDVYVGEDNVGYEESYGDDFAGGDGDCDFEVGGDFGDDGYDQGYDENYGENDFESYSDITGGSESMYDEGESYGTMDNSQYSGLNEEPNNQYAPMVGPVGGPGTNNQNQYGQNGRQRNMGMYRRGGTNMNRYGNVNQGANRYQPRTMGRPVQYRPNGRPNMANGGPNGPTGLGNPMLMNTMVRGLCQGFAMNMLIGGGGDANGGVGDGSGGDLFGGGVGDSGGGDLFGGEAGSLF